jgi:mono/diheme cytochrome c family protein
MKQFSVVVSGVVLYLLSCAAPARGQADAQRGAEVLQRERCVECHAIAGRGAGQHAVAAPDLGKRASHAYTPARLASEMWNHAPQMWQAMEAKKISIPKLTERDSEDVFAYFYSLSFFDPPGDAARGAVVFEEKGCSTCHSLSPVQRGTAKGPGTPVATWNAVSDPVLLVQQMWNHASSMQRTLTARHMAWLPVTGQDLLDVSAYLDSLPVIHAGPGRFSLPEPAAGKRLFDSRCAICHQGTLSLEKRMANLTLTDVAAHMWNHAPRMIGSILNPAEMRQIVAYVWELQYMGPPGDVAKGREAFVEKSCAGCHEGPSAIASARREQVYTPLKMVGAVWVHGPGMLQKVTAAGGKWPTLSPAEVADVVAYLNTRP